MSSNEDLLRVLNDLRRETQDSRDAIMHRLGANEGTLKTLTNELATVRAVAERAEKTALEAKRKASDSMHEIEVNFAAVTAHVEKSMKPLQENDAKQNAALVTIQESLAERARKATSDSRVNAAVIVAAIAFFDHIAAPLLAHWLGK